MGDDRQHRVELKVPGHTADSDAGIVADHLGRHLNDGLRNHRIDLAWHDGGAGLEGGENDLTEASARPRAKPADVIRHLLQAHRHRLERPARLHDRILTSLGGEMTFRLGERELGHLGQVPDDQIGKLWMGVDPGPYGRATERELGQRGSDLCEPRHAKLDLSRVAGKLLPQPNGSCILQVSWSLRRAGRSSRSTICNAAR